MNSLNNDVLSVFANLADHGGLSGDSIYPGAFQGLTWRVTLSQRSAQCSLQNLIVDPSSHFILVNMLHWFHIKVSSLRSAFILWPPEQLVKDASFVEFPSTFPKLSFNQRIDEISDEFDIEVDLDGLASDDILKQFVDVVDIWFMATHRGAFSSDTFEPSASGVFPGEDIDIEPDSLIWYVDRFRTQMEALDSLLNIFEWLHHNIFRIKEVTISR
ncbi:hypothetical protein [Mesorhizobium sp. LNJC405B00]|uniref:hypothetical protein n=1 Tax=unclassified Mesorhizobium TaxID=325217 RepID=UPI000AF64AE2|nr:hypothetical protein [Mesorhizobium sp. LNJC405B00]